MNNRRALLLLPLWLIVALITLIASGTPSAAASSGPETRVRANSTAVETSVAAISSERPASVGCVRPESADLASGSCVATEAVDDVFHYTKGEFVDSISTNGLLAGSYATPDGGLSPLQAQIELALPPNTGLRDAVMRVDLAGLREAGYEIPAITRVTGMVTGPGGRVYTMPGGGYEMRFPYAIPPAFIKVVTS